MARVQAQTCRAFLLATALTFTITGCGPTEEHNGDGNAPTTNTSEPAMNLPIIAPVDRKLDRRGLLEAVWSAASSAASGTDDSSDQRALDGRQFEIRIRFGCAGPEQALKSVPLGWSFNERDRTLRVRAAPTINKKQPRVAELAPQNTEAVEGFWIPRPWLLDAACPAASAIEPAIETRQMAAEEQEPKAGPASTHVPVSGKVGIAEFFSTTDARTGRRDSRAYEDVQVLAKDQPPSSQGFNLVLTGRLRALPGRKVINCIRDDRDAPPDCVAAAAFDRVFIEQPETGAIVAVWSQN
jgi:hypothetical protein